MIAPLEDFLVLAGFERRADRDWQLPGVNYGFTAQEAVDVARQKGLRPVNLDPTHDDLVLLMRRYMDFIDYYTLAIMTHAETVGVDFDPDDAERIKSVIESWREEIE